MKALFISTLILFSFGVASANEDAAQCVVSIAKHNTAYQIRVSKNDSLTDAIDGELVEQFGVNLFAADTTRIFLENSEKEGCNVTKALQVLDATTEEI